MDSNYSLADIRAATDRNGYGCNDGFGFGGPWWMIVLFLIAGNGFGGWGGGNGFLNGALTRTDLQQGFDTQEITRKLDGIGYGLSDGFYAQNTTMLQGFADVTTAVREAQFAAQACCCETNRNLDSVRYDALKNTCDITTAIHAEGEATRALIKQNEIQQLRDKVAELQLAQSQCAQNAYLTNAFRFPGNCGGCCGGYGSFNGNLSAAI